MHPSPKLIRVLSRVLLALAGTATLLALFVTVENWRGDRAWAALEKEMRARGERIRFDEFAPPLVPHAQNLFAAPLLAETLFGRSGATSEKDRRVRSPFRGFHSFTDPDVSPPDFVALRAQLQKNGFLKIPFTAAPVLDILHSLEPVENLLDELRTAARARPLARIPRNPQPLSTALWLDLDTAFALANALTMRARAEIALGRTANAHADIFALQRYANGVTAHPATRIELLVGVEIHASAQRAITDGIRRQAWTDAQLAEFQNQLSALQPLAGWREALLHERAVAFYVLDSGPPVPLMPEWPRWLFHGWAQQNKVSIYRRSQSEIFSAFTTEPPRIKPASPTPPAPPRGGLTRWVSPYEVLTRLFINNVANITVGVGTAVDRLALGSVSGALERHRLAHGRHPAALADLVPIYLRAVPTSIFDGKPVRYLTLPDGTHELRTSGKDGRDDQGSGDDIVLKIPAAP